MNDAERPENRQPPSLRGKWFVIILAPLLIVISIWLFYLRVQFKHPTNLMPSATAAGKNPS
jgi:hypothetical protein